MAFLRLQFTPSSAIDLRSVRDDTPFVDLINLRSEADLHRRAFVGIAAVLLALQIGALLVQVLNPENQPSFWWVLGIRVLEMAVVGSALVWAAVDPALPRWVAPTVLAANYFLALVMVSSSGGHRLLSIGIFLLDGTQFLLAFGLFLRKQWITVAGAAGLMALAVILFLVLPRNSFPQVMAPDNLELGFLSLLFFGLVLITGFVVANNYVARKITERAVETAERLRVAAFQDPTTELPNGLQLEQDMRDWEADPGSRRLSLVMAGFRLDGLEELNESLGVEATTLLVAEIIRDYAEELAAMGRLLPQYRRPTAFRGLYRVESNLFLFAATVPDQTRGQLSERQILGASIRRVLDRRALETSLSFQGGYTYFPDDADTLRQLLRNLLNMLHSRHPDFLGRFAPFNRDLYQENLRREELRLAMQASLEVGEFQLVFQPKVDTVARRVVGFEALARWSRPTGPIPPSDFIPLAEETGQIAELTRKLVVQAYRFLDELAAKGREHLSVAVNLSPGVFTPDFLDELLAQLTVNGYGPRVQIEITEGVLMRLSGALHDRFSRLKALGVTFAIDDFGTGYSNLGYLQTLEADVLKIDKRFIDGIPADEKNGKLVRAIVQMAHSLDMVVVAEGVEYQEQGDYLLDLHCDQIQGYFYAKPLAFSAALEFEVKPT